MKIKPTTKKGRVLVELAGTDDRMLATSPLLIKEILVPIDFSSCSEKALEYAVPFARQFQARISLLHVVQLNYLVGTEFATVDYSILEKDLMKRAERELEKLATFGSQIPTRTFVRVGQPVVEVAKAAKELDADLIIISTHGRTGLKHMVLGSVVENVVRHATCPVLVVRENEHEFVQT